MFAGALRNKTGNRSLTQDPAALEAALREEKEAKRKEEEEKARQSLFKSALKHSTGTSSLHGQPEAGHEEDPKAAEERLAERERQMRAEKERKRAEEEAQANAALFSSAIKSTGDGPAHKTRLLECKGRRRVCVRQVAFDSAAMRRGDVYVLDTGDKLFIWKGPASNILERAKAVDFCTRVKHKERSSSVEIYDLDINSKTGATAEFWEIMGGRVEPPDDADDNTDAKRDTHDKEFELHYRTHILKLFRCLEKPDHPDEIVLENGVKSVGEVLKHSHLKSSHVYLLDADTEIYVWCGKSSSLSLRTRVFDHAQKMLSGRPEWVDVQRIPEAGEPTLFKEKFGDWADTLPVSVAGVSSEDSAIKNVAGESEYMKYDARLMHSTPHTHEDEGDSSDYMLATHMRPLSHSSSVMIIEEGKLVSATTQPLGHFFAADTSLIQVKFDYKTRERILVYLWQGNECTRTDLGTSALIAQSLSQILRQRGGDTDQKRVEQHKEPSHLQMVLPRVIAIHQGNASAVLGGVDADSHVKLYHVQPSQSHLIARAQFVHKPSARSLNSRDGFVLHTFLENKTTQYVWIGKACRGTRKQDAIDAGAFLLPKDSSDVHVDSHVIDEGQEPESFWAALGGKSGYASHAPIFDVPETFTPRLFLCDHASGKFVVTEMLDMAQTDLDPNNAMFLDAFSACFLWVGPGCTQIEKKTRHADCS
eukprot:TRINITY_DN3401_c0_g1_i1.p1 TRINITY_DN3401_c0_g1~~TRINITY_DN3401_c0_g1_i1.p1  ORF type:complete len:738 (+),score=169.40 TRINITY_DN3401_c0_g1_i1:105-2216(+)